MKKDDFTLLVGLNGLGVQFIHFKELIDELGYICPEYKEECIEIIDKINALEDKLSVKCHAMIDEAKFEE